MALAGKTCTPCRGGIPPLGRAGAEGYLAETPHWVLKDDAGLLQSERAWLVEVK